MNCGSWATPILRAALARNPIFAGRRRRREADEAECMGGKRRTARMGLVLVGVAVLLALLGMPGTASGHTSCSQIATVYGIPPWGFHTGSYTGQRNFAKGHG